MPEISDSKYLIQMDWTEVPHLSDDEKQKIWDSTPPHLRDARSKGLPSMGAGAIYPVPESEIKVDPFPIPDYFPRVYALDVGWNRTAALWAAIDRQGPVVYLCSEYYRAQAEPSIHTAGIRARGDWIPGVIDPASAGSGQRDGRTLLEEYRELGLDLIEADNSIEAGIHKVYEWLSTGRIKVFSTLQNFFMEYRLYRRNENGKIVKEMDHLMDDLRYLIMTGINYAIVKPRPRKEFVNYSDDASRHTGY